MESWRDRIRREAGEMDAAIRAALALDSDEAVRGELERLVRLPQFGSFTWLWVPAVAKRNLTLFRPVILSLFERGAIDRHGKAFDPWHGETARELEALLERVDAADDVELTKRLYSWRAATLGEGWWRADLIKRVTAATTTTARHTALAKCDLGAWPGLDPATALELWSIDPAATRKFIASHLPWDAKLKDWQGLLERSRGVDPELHFELYRKVVDAKTWAADVRALPATPDLIAELDRRHPVRWDLSPGPTFHALLVAHGAAALPYVVRRAGAIGPRWTWYGQTQGSGLSELLKLAEDRGWTTLWATLLRTSATRELYDTQVKKLVRAGDRARLERLAGRGRETHGAGFSFAQTHALLDDTAVELYACYPALVRGAYRVNVTPTWNEGFPKLARAAIASGDHELTDFLASRLAGVQYQDPSMKSAIEAIVAHYEGLPEAAFVTHAAGALSRMPAFGVWAYATLVQSNALARLLFERSTARYLADPAAVRDLLESPQIHVQLLGFRILGQDDPRASAIAAAHVDLLQASLLRRLRSRSRKLAFAALGRAAAHDEATARYLLGRMRDALALPEKRYPTEELVGLMGAVLARWPALRGPREQPVIYGGSV